jgi:hypothetical protein
LIREKEKTSKFCTCGELVIGNMDRERAEGRYDGKGNTQHTHIHNGHRHIHRLKTHMERREEGERKRERDKGKTEQREKYNRETAANFFVIVVGVVKSFERTQLSQSER